MLKSVYGFDPEILTSGSAIKVIDSNKFSAGQGHLISFEQHGDYARENLTGNYIVSANYVTELWLTSAKGGKYEINLRHVNGENPRLKIELLSN